MVDTSMVKVIFLLFLVTSSWSKTLVEKIHLGEYRSADYQGRFEPVLIKNDLSGREYLQEDLIYEHLLNPFHAQLEKTFRQSFKPVLSKNIACTDLLLSEHESYLRYLHRLLILSYSAENLFQLTKLSEQLRLKTKCNFQLSSLSSLCQNTPDPELQKFSKTLLKVRPDLEINLSKSYSLKDFFQEMNSKKTKWTIQGTLMSECRGGCSSVRITEEFNRSCEASVDQWKSICGLKDHFYGLSESKDAYYLLGLSHALTNINKRGEGIACLSRYSELYQSKEAYPKHLSRFISDMEKSLRSLYQQRYLLGQIFIYGSAQEFEKKLSVVFKEVAPIPETKIEKNTVTTQLSPKTPIVTLEKKESLPTKLNETKAEVPVLMKTAFLEAADQRRSMNLRSLDVDMLKFKYDYVFSLNAINNLTERLKLFMSREALQEMVSFDKLGSKDGPVPLLFIKFMIDQQEHQGLWNLVGILGQTFYVSNELDTKFKTQPELIELKNDASTSNQWQIVLRAE